MLLPIQVRFSHRTQLFYFLRFSVSDFFVTEMHDPTSPPSRLRFSEWSTVFFPHRQCSALAYLALFIRASGWWHSILLMIYYSNHLVRLNDLSLTHLYTELNTEDIWNLQLNQDVSISLLTVVEKKPRLLVLKLSCALTSAVLGFLLSVRLASYVNFKALVSMSVAVVVS